MCDENVSAYMIMLIRMITSCEIQRRMDHFLPFVIGMTDGSMEIEDFCRCNVEAMGEESDHIQLVAVADAFQVLSNSHLYSCSIKQRCSIKLRCKTGSLPISMYNVIWHILCDMAFEAFLCDMYHVT